MLRGKYIILDGYDFSQYIAEEYSVTPVAITGANGSRYTLAGGYKEDILAYVAEVSMAFIPFLETDEAFGELSSILFDKGIVQLQYYHPGIGYRLINVMHNYPTFTYSGGLVGGPGWKIDGVVLTEVL